MLHIQQIPKAGHNHFLPHPLEFIIHWSSYLFDITQSGLLTAWHYTAWCTDSMTVQILGYWQHDTTKPGLLEEWHYAVWATDSKGDDKNIFQLWKLWQGQILEFHLYFYYRHWNTNSTFSIFNNFDYLFNTSFITFNFYLFGAQYHFKKQSAITQPISKICIISEGCVLCKHKDF